MLRLGLLSSIGLLGFLAFKLRPPKHRPATPSSGKFKYDVFLSFRGKDTPKNFTDHLYSALKDKGIITFRDDEELESGESIAPNLLNAIEESRCAVVVFSRNYANSSRCLDEIAEMVDCMKAKGQKILLVFYHVHPSEVRRQTGNHFGKAFANQQKRFEGNPDKVQRWKDALSQVANLSGWTLKDGHESKVIREIVEKIFNEKISAAVDGLVGMEYHVNQMLSYLDMECPDDVRIIGICGNDGIGKTTIAQVVSEMVKAQFDGVSFLENVREVTEKQGAVHLQNKLLLDLLQISTDVHNTIMGQNIIRDTLHAKKVLIVLDDVDNNDQLEPLCDREWFGPGSRIILTSRDDNLLRTFPADKVYKVNPLTDAEALTLFGMKAFGEDQLVGKDFLKLSKEFLKYAYGLPLAIKVLGGSVKGRDVKFWSSTLNRLKNNPKKNVTDILKVSFEVLEETEKEIVLDIACCFKGHDRDLVTRILQGCDNEIEILIEKSMVTLFGRRLWMHDLIQTMGREIVIQQYPEEPEKRSRLWVPEEITHVLDQSKATSSIESILLQGPTNDNDVHSLNDSFSNMDRLRLLNIWNVKFSGRRLWMHDLIQTMGREIVIQQYPEEPEKRSSLWVPEELIHVLDQSKATSSIESILLQGPTNDNDVHSLNDSFSNMDRLRLLNIWNVKFSGNIKYLSNELQYLEWLECPLNSFPSTFKPDKLVKLRMPSSRIEQLWKGKKGWGMLRLIDMTRSKYLISTPDFTEVPFLEILMLDQCTSLVEVHPSLGFLKKLKYLSMRVCSVESMPPFTSVESLEFLSLSQCLRLKKFPEIEGNMKRLRELHLDETSIEELPPSVEHLTGLTTLNLTGCENLLYLSSTIQCLTRLKSLNLTGCTKLYEIPENLNCVESLEQLHIGGTAIRDTTFLVGMKNLKSLSCHGCISRAPRSLLLPASLSSLTSLVKLDLSDCNLMDGDIPDDLSSLISLRVLDLSGNCFVRLPESFSQLSKLETLLLRNCRRLELVPKKFPLSLQYVYAEGCTSLTVTDYPNQVKVLTQWSRE